MNTYKEISTSKRVNRKFWNDHTRFTISLIREYEKGASDKYLALARSYRGTLQRALENRSTYKYLERN
jgi:hypothetical protein